MQGPNLNSTLERVTSSSWAGVLGLGRWPSGVPFVRGIEARINNPKNGWLTERKTPTNMRLTIKQLDRIDRLYGIFSHDIMINELLKLHHFRNANRSFISWSLFWKALFNSSFWGSQVTWPAYTIIARCDRVVVSVIAMTTILIIHIYTLAICNNINNNDNVAIKSQV